MYQKIFSPATGIVTVLNSAKRWTPVDKQELDKVSLFSNQPAFPLLPWSITVNPESLSALSARNWRSLVSQKKSFGSASCPRSWFWTQQTLSKMWEYLQTRRSYSPRWKCKNISKSYSPQLKCHFLPPSFYLRPTDLDFCLENTDFSEEEILQWFRKFR